MSLVAKWMKRWTYFFIRCVNIFKFWYVFLNLCFNFFVRYLFNKDFLLIIIIITIIREFIICTIIATNFISFIYNVTIIVIIATITLILVDITIIWIVLNFTMTRLNSRPIFFFFFCFLVYHVENITILRYALLFKNYIKQKRIKNTVTYEIYEHLWWSFSAKVVNGF